MGTLSPAAPACGASLALTQGCFPTAGNERRWNPQGEVSTEWVSWFYAETLAQNTDAICGTHSPLLFIVETPLKKPLEHQHKYFKSKFAGKDCY